jgi:hypothetical protein
MKYVIKAEEALLKQTGKLTSHPHIFCVRCEGKTTAFGSNLTGKIKKAGSLEALLSAFECRNCRTAGANKVRLPKAPRSKRGAKGAAKLAKKEELLRNLPKMEFTEHKPIVLVSNPELAAEVTAHSCLRPDVFLDSNRSCDFCALYQVCKAPNRSLSKQGWQMGLAA